MDKKNQLKASLLCYKHNKIMNIIRDYFLYNKKPTSVYSSFIIYNVILNYSYELKHLIYSFKNCSDYNSNLHRLASLITFKAF